MRTRQALVAGLLLAALTGGCAQGAAESPDVATAQSTGPGGTVTPSATTSTDPDAPLAYARCMRENGMTWFPDPNPDGGTMLTVPNGVSRQDMQAAEEACRQYAPTRDGVRKPNAEDLEKVRQMAACMRENGVPNFPDPNADGSLELDGGELGTGPGDPIFDKAEKACSAFLPQGGRQNQEQG
ncbi:MULTISPECIES: hypothetical protein [Actinoplanes]|uniref:hypothetical protein n=1 Tax=Actinoplanes TaxID=1865 RepID=UPI0005F277B0|nr:MULTISPECIES: hypothetical protein [Actinoplanes]GLY01390.1 hypothetical protein Acsp01_17690 [Actinoplanes sp. NBRC 101535]